MKLSNFIKNEPVKVKVIEVRHPTSHFLLEKEKRQRGEARVRATLQK